MKQEDGILPRCQTEAGCKIEHLASHKEINSQATSFLKYKRLNQSNALQILQEQTLKASGFYYDVDLLLDAENIYFEFIENKRRKERQRQQSITKTRRR